MVARAAGRVVKEAVDSLQTIAINTIKLAKLMGNRTAYYSGTIYYP